MQDAATEYLKLVSYITGEEVSVDDEEYSYETITEATPSSEESNYQKRISLDSKSLDEDSLLLQTIQEDIATDDDDNDGSEKYDGDASDDCCIAALKD